MNLDKDRMKNQMYQQFVANVMLDSERLKKIRDVYFGYGGEVISRIYQVNGGVYEEYVKCVRKNIIDIIKREAKTGIMSASQIERAISERMNHNIIQKNNKENER